MRLPCFLAISPLLLSSNSAAFMPSHSQPSLMARSRLATINHHSQLDLKQHRRMPPVLFVSHWEAISQLDQENNKSDPIIEKKFGLLKFLNPTVGSAPLVDAIPDDAINGKLASEPSSVHPKAADRFSNAKIFNGGKVLDYATYPNHEEFPDISLKELMKMMDGAPPLEYLLSPKKIVHLLSRILQINVGFCMTSKDVEHAKTTEEKYHAIFTKPKMLWGLVPNPLDLIPLPEHVFKSWDKDKEFARQFLNGANPLMIHVVMNVQDDLSPEVVEFFKHDATVNLQALAAQKRLLFVRYDDLSDLPANPHQAFPLPYNTGRAQNHPYYFAKRPLVVFQLSQNLSELEVLVIQLEQGGEVYSPTSTDPNVWLFVKAAVKSADAQMHEWVNHLGRTHLTMEPHILAIHNTLKAKHHPVFTFLRPIIQDTLFFNHLARGTLAEFGDNSFGDFNSAVGVGQLMQLIKKYWQRYSFFESSGFEQELAGRGFDPGFEMPCYLYREDGKKLWKAYGEFASDFVDEIYQSDDDVAKDAVLQEWAKETTDPSKAAVPGFPTKFDDKKTLAKVLQTLFWIASGLHAAVNFPQYDYYAYLANHPFSFRLGMDKFQQNGDHSREFMFTNAFPTLESLKQFITTTWVLTTPSNHCIDNISDNFKSIGKQSYRRFKEKLTMIGNDIQARNAESSKKGEPIYPYLHPSRVPASIDI